MGQRSRKKISHQIRDFGVKISASMHGRVTGPGGLTRWPSQCLHAVAEGDRPADAALLQNDMHWRRRRGEFGTMLLLVAVAIIGIASALSLFAAGIVLLTRSSSAVRLAAPSLMQGVPTAPAAKHSSSQVSALPTLAPAPAAPRIVAVDPQPATPPPVAAPPRTVAPLAPKAKPPPEAARFALMQGDANFRGGEVSVARFFYEQAVDGGDADATVRMGETFDPAFLTLERLRRAYADPEAARFWYERALALGVAEAKQRLAYLDAEGGTTPTARSERSRHRAASARRSDPVACPPVTTFEQVVERVLHPCR
jgi:hypothetical protein